MDYKNVILHLRSDQFRYNISIWSSIMSICFGLVVLISWRTDLDIIKVILPDKGQIAANTALCFIIVGVVLLLLIKNRNSRILSVLSVVLSVFILLVTSLTLLEYIYVADFGIDQIIANQYISSDTIFPGRMSPITAFCLVL